MKAIFKREWRSYFYSPIGYIFAGVFIALCSFFFVNGALMYQSADLNIVFSNINVIYLFLVSILTMGLFSTERSRRTDQLLLTSPVSVSKIVIGKYFAAMGVFGITLLLSLIYPFILRMFGNPSTSEMLGAYIGFILLWGAFIAIGLFISALTESQMIAAIVTFGVLLIVFYMNALSANIGSETVKNIVRWFSLMDRYSEFQSGILNVVNVVYYLSFVFVFIFLTIQVIRRRQYSDAKFRANNLIVTAAGIAAVILVNAIVSTVAAKLPMKIDMTHDSVYEYSEQTREVLDSLTDEVDIYALYPDGAENTLVTTIREYLDQYKQMSSKINVTYKDPYEDPSFARKYGDDVSVGSVVVQQGERFRVIPLEKIYNQSRYTGSTSIDAEKQLTSAIRYVSGLGQEVKAYFIKGHNEFGGSSSQLASEFENEGYSVGEVTIATEGIPEDADLLVSLAPSADFSAEERDALDAYLLKGGKAAFVFTAGTQPMERLSGYLAEWGITVNSDFAVEGDGSRAFRMSGSGVPIPAPELQKHTITEKLMNGDVEFIAPASCSFTENSTNPQYATVTALLKTSKNSWGITDPTSGTLEKKDGDISGPLTLAAISEKTDETGGKIFVLGSVQAIEMQGLLNNSSYCNGDFVLNAFSYLTDKGDALNIRAKVISAESLSMSERQITVVGIILLYVIPILIVIAGLIIWLKRRYL